MDFLHHSSLILSGLIANPSCAYIGPDIGAEQWIIEGKPLAGEVRNSGMGGDFRAPSPEVELKGFVVVVAVVIFSTHIVLALQRNQAKYSLSIKISYKKLAHMIMEAENCYGFLCVSQRPEKLME